MVEDEPFRSTMLGQYEERNVTKFCKKHPKRSKMQPRMERSCRSKKRNFLLY